LHAHRRALQPHRRARRVTSSQISRLRRCPARTRQTAHARIRGGRQPRRPRCRTTRFHTCSGTPERPRCIRLRPEGSQGIRHRQGPRQPVPTTRREAPRTQGCRPPTCPLSRPSCCMLRRRRGHSRCTSRQRRGSRHSQRLPSSCSLCCSSCRQSRRALRIRPATGAGGILGRRI